MPQGCVYAKSKKEGEGEEGEEGEGEEGAEGEGDEGE